MSARARIERLLEAGKMSQSEIARMVGVSRQYVGQVLHGEAVSGGKSGPKPKYDEEIVKMINADPCMGTSAIARALGVRHSYVIHRLNVIGYRKAWIKADKS